MEYQTVFTTRSKQSYPLSLELLNSARSLFSTINSARSLSDLDQFEPENMHETINTVRRISPKLGGLRPADVRDEGWRKDAASGRRIGTWQHFVALEVTGDIHLLAHWPDSEPDDLLPLDAAQPTVEAWNPAVSTQYEKEAVGLDHFPEWTLGIFQDDPPLGWALFTHVFLTVSEEDDVASGVLDLLGLFNGRRQALDPFVDKVASQTNSFFDEELPHLLLSRANEKRRALENRAAVTKSLQFADAWRLPAPALAKTTFEEEPLPSLTPSEPAPSTVLSAMTRPRLSEATFSDVQRTIRIWADSVERYPKSFAAHHEDRLSDLLAATLNATLPGAEREVYTRNGKSDIFIHADALSAGAGPATVFICESKWARSRGVVEKALDPQLFGYMNTHDTAAVLLLLLPTQDLATATGIYLQVLRGVSGFLEEKASAVAGWPILVYEREHRTVQVCVAFIHLPRQRPEAIELDDWGHVVE